MSWISRQWTGLVGWARERARAFLLGPAVVDEVDRRWGRDPARWSPSEYGQYLATSNPIYACATLRAELLASLPLRFYRTLGSGAGVGLVGLGREEITSGPLVELVRHVNPFWTLGRLIRMTELARCLWGKAYWFAERGGGRGRPREIWWARPDQVWVMPHPTEYVERFEYRPLGVEEPILFSVDETVWFPMDNPLDEFDGLAPLAAARLAVDTRSAAMKSNRLLFSQGMQMGGVLMPTKGVKWSKEQSDKVEAKLEQRLQGVDRAHRWGVFRNEIQLQQLGVTPKDAEFLGLLQITLEDACRAYRVPLDVMGGQRSYENFGTALKALWEICILPEARALAEQIGEGLLPMFARSGASGVADVVEFDSSQVAVIQEDATAVWERERGQIQVGAITVNEWRTAKGLSEVEWGDERYGEDWLYQDEDEGSSTDGEMDDGDTEGGETSEGSETSEGVVGEEEGRGRRARAEADGVEVFGGSEHRRVWGRYQRRVELQEREFGRVVEGVMRRIEDSVLDRLRDGPRMEKFTMGRGVEETLFEPFDLGRWRGVFEEESTPVLEGIVRFHMAAALDDLGLNGALFEMGPFVTRFAWQRAQRFAEHVAETTWENLKGSLVVGMNSGEGIPELEERVREVMGDRIRSSSETIARTEVVGASNGGILEGWRASGVVVGKVWISALLPGRTRDSHADAHGQRVGIDEDFEVGEGRGPAPGQIGRPEEDIDCLCTMSAVLDTDADV